MKHFKCFPPAAYLGAEAQQTRGRVGCWCSGWCLALSGILHLTHTQTHYKYDIVPLNCESDLSPDKELRRLSAASCTMLLQALMLLSNAAGAGLFFAVKVEKDASAAISCWNGAPRHSGR